jgi:hypothetical protein
MDSQLRHSFSLGHNCIRRHWATQTPDNLIRLRNGAVDDLRHRVQEIIASSAYANEIIVPNELVAGGPGSKGTGGCQSLRVVEVPEYSTFKVVWDGVVGGERVVFTDGRSPLEAVDVGEEEDGGDDDDE